VALSCAQNNVVIDFNTVYITDTHPDINVSAVGGSMPGSLSGQFTNATDFEASFTIPGGSVGCTEAYKLVGSFTSDTEFSGLFTATFTASIPMLCSDCEQNSNPNQPDFSWQINGTR
jgi:hypothetical protein